MRLESDTSDALERDLPDDYTDGSFARTTSTQSDDVRGYHREGKFIQLYSRDGRIREELVPPDTLSLVAPLDLRLLILETAAALAT